MNPNKMKISLIGTGVMGAPIAKHMANNGYDVSVYNRTFSKAKSLEPLVTAHETIESCIKDSDVIFTIVGYPKDVEDVFEIIAKHAKESAILVDMTTSSPALAQQISNRVVQRCLDAPVTGGDIGAINGTLSIMVGGDKEAFETVKPILETFGKTITYMGSSGKGQHAKLANQVAIAGSLAGIAESLAYAQRKHLNLEDMLKVIVGGSAQSWQAANNGLKMIADDFKPGFYVKHFLKDLNLILSEQEDLPLPITESVQRIFTILAEEGYGDEGTQAIYKYYVE